MRSGEHPGEQLALVRAAIIPQAASAPDSGSVATGDSGVTDPVASVLVDTGLAHLDRPFEYSVPAALAEQAVPGARVKVRFAGQDLDGFVLARAATAEHDGRLAPLRRVVSPEPVLTPDVLRAATAVARRYAGTTSDVLRLAVPPRHARAEAALPQQAPEAVAAQPSPAPATGAWEVYAAGPAFLRRVAAGEAPGAALLALPSTDPDCDWPALLAQAAAATAAGGRGSILVVPDARDVERVDAALLAALGPGRHVRLTADQGPQARYTAYLKVLRGHVPVVVGTRAAAWAPVRDLGLLAWWDDGSDLHEEPRAPYAPVREVLAARADVEGAALLTAGHARSVAVEGLVRAGRLRSIEPDRAALRRAVPRVRVAGEGEDAGRDPAAAHAHLPTVAWQAAREGLERGPVLVQVPRRGYLPALSCQTCRRPARCPHCAGPLALPGPGRPPACGWCGRSPVRWECPHCGDHRLRSAVVGARRTAEELGRAFPGVPVTTSGAGDVVASVPAAPRLVIATPGAEPVAEGGYAACLLLDAWALLDRPDLRAGEEAVRRWLEAMALTRGSADGGRCVLAGAPTHVTIPAVEAVVRWDPVWFAGRELDERVELGLPPARRVATLTGARAVLDDAVREMTLPPSTSVLGPLPVASGDERVLLTVEPGDGDALAAEVAAVRARRSARKDRLPLAARLDPPDPST